MSVAISPGPPTEAPVGPPGEAPLQEAPPGSPPGSPPGAPLGAPEGPREEKTFFGLPTALRPDGRLSAKALRPISVELGPLRGPRGSARCSQVGSPQQQQRQQQHQ
ncbi:3' exoribonuclease family, domain 1 containing protein, putative [Eimeria tenella]|uniref:3' exoribonuclease family, domain 1 containing protein, putative n=1 Tax=Eimeria tenella TaxID=5802 RepID=U6KKG3_EIMTE|nr:3' exoribonuclease family, domain 1 containing protein, putative [Eimeria tenella]CDJ38515.1 3' exoribonuclease family, domain 1 containing protein, putative [Eimeria tenella]|eukprot:XP_013229353.1 3' exoribonuclease family, domain 1 containing protein, putative [Eimeria tenella]